MSETTVMTTIGEAPAAAEETAEAFDANQPTEGATETPPPQAVGPDPRIELARRYDAAAKRESKARRQAEAVEQRHAEAVRERAELAREREVLKSELEAFRSDPVGYELKSGRDPVDAVRRFAQPESQEQKEIRELRARLDAREQADQEHQTKAQQHMQSEARFATLQGFVGSITPDEFPNLTSLYRASEVPDLVDSLLSEKGEDGETLLDAFRDRHGRNPSNKEIQQALEHQARVRASSLFEGFKKVFEPPSPAPVANRGPSLSNQHAGRLESSNGHASTLSLDERRAIGLKAFKDQLEAETDRSD